MLATGEKEEDMGGGSGGEAEWTRQQEKGGQGPSGQSDGWRRPWWGRRCQVDKVEGGGGGAGKQSWKGIEAEWTK